MHFVKRCDILYINMKEGCSNSEARKRKQEKRGENTDLKLYTEMHEGTEYAPHITKHIRTICAWHEETPKDEIVSHGICQDCSDKMMAPDEPSVDWTKYSYRNGYLGPGHEKDEESRPTVNQIQEQAAQNRVRKIKEDHYGKRK